MKMFIAGVQNVHLLVQPGIGLANPQLQTIRTVFGHIVGFFLVVEAQPLVDSGGTLARAYTGGFKIAVEQQVRAAVHGQLCIVPVRRPEHVARSPAQTGR